MEQRKSRGGWKVDRVKQQEIDAEAENRAVAAFKQGRMGTIAATWKNRLNGRF